MSLQQENRLSVSELLSNLLREARRRLRLLSILFLIVCLGALFVGWSWPKKYSANTTILVSEDKTIEKLMEGKAVATNVSERVLIAREVMFSQKVMDKVLATGGWLSDAPSAAERDVRADALQQRTLVSSPRENLLRIEFRDVDPQRAYLVAKTFADEFLAESRAAQVRESREAYEFILDRVSHYQSKLNTAQQKLDTYQVENPQSRIEPASLIEARIGLLRRKLDSDQARLDGDVGRTAATVVVGEDLRAPLRQRLSGAEEALGKLEQQYTDAHPDVSRARREVAELRGRLAQTPAPRVVRSGGGGGDNAALRARITRTEKDIHAELERVREMADPSPELAELARERDVPRDLYQDLLRRLEYARLSLSLDEEGRGLSFQIQEEASVPTRASGLRFLHFVLGGLAAAFALPLALLLALVQLDPRLRSANAVQRSTGIPVLAAVPMYWNGSDQRRLVSDMRFALIAVGSSLLLLGGASVFKLVLGA